MRQQDIELADAKAEVERLQAEVEAERADVAELSTGLGEAWEALGEIAGILNIDEGTHEYESAGAIMAEIRPRLRCLTGEVSPFDGPPLVDDAALRIAPHGGPVVVQEPGRLVRTEPPIESLGPVPADVPGSLRSRVEWLISDAVRRGAKLEGGA